MIVTAYEALGNVCCKSYTPDDKGGLMMARCRGHFCMAWRWKDKAWNELSVVYRCLCCKSHDPAEYDAGERRGYCGMAGPVK